jgi:hypothetical protein
MITCEFIKKYNGDVEQIINISVFWNVTMSRWNVRELQGYTALHPRQ